ncbi:hypothetical protein NQ318_016381 [Aromia moschata]|uniref:Uncharacterized protein n=1 Tax=Aromia moschata TaxID=1265417 RepID=A0AAV8Z627_9CUCU|nr:hypothetical protein NQ318_016381 [Aromia moschata]
MNSIQNLLKTPFSSLSLEEKVQIKTLENLWEKVESRIRTTTFPNKQPLLIKSRKFGQSYDK